VRLGVDPGGLAAVLVSLAAAAVVSMQIGGRVEQAPAKPVMSRLYASFSIGNLLAAGAVLLVAGLAGDGARVITPALVTLSAASVVALLAASRRVPGHAGGGRMLAIVVTFGNGAFLIGPVIVGTLIRAVGIRHAMAFPLVLGLVLVALSRVLSRTEPWEDGGRPASLAIPESPRILR
jgi:hypothetical protein